MGDGALRFDLERPFPSPLGDNELIELARRAAEEGPSAALIRTRLASGEEALVKLGRRGPWRRVLDRFTGRPTRSEVASAVAVHLAGAGVSTPEVFGCVVARARLGVARWDAAVSRALAATTLTEALGAEPGRAPALIDACAALVARMHGAGVFHGDLKGANLLVDGPAEGPAVYVIDLEGARRAHGLSTGQRARDLGRLWVSLDVLGLDGERLIATYAEIAGIPDASAIAAGVERYARRKRQQNARRGRPLT